MVDLNTVLESIKLRLEEITGKSFRSVQSEMTPPPVVRSEQKKERDQDDGNDGLRSPLLRSPLNTQMRLRDLQGLGNSKKRPSCSFASDKDKENRQLARHAAIFSAIFICARVAAKLLN